MIRTVFLTEDRGAGCQVAASQVKSLNLFKMRPRNQFFQAKLVDETKG